MSGVQRTVQTIARGGMLVEARCWASSPRRAREATGCVARSHAARGPGGAGPGERSRSSLLLKQDTENMLILLAKDLAVNGALSFNIVSMSV